MFCEFYNVSANQMVCTGSMHVMQCLDIEKMLHECSHPGARAGGIFDEWKAMWSSTLPSITTYKSPNRPLNNQRYRSNTDRYWRKSLPSGSAEQFQKYVLLCFSAVATLPNLETSVDTMIFTCILVGIERQETEKDSDSIVVF